MGLSQKKQMSIARARRAQYVLDRSTTKNLSRPFVNSDQNDAALRYIDTGEEELKSQFPFVVQNTER